LLPLFHRSIHSEPKCVFGPETDGTTGPRTSDLGASRPDGWIAEGSPELMPRTCTTRAAAPDILAWGCKHEPGVLTMERL